MGYVAPIQKFQVLNQRNIAWKENEKKERKAGDMELLTGILHTEGQLEEICAFPLPKDHPPVGPGFYTILSEWRSDYDKKLVARVVGVVPFVARGVSVAAGKVA